LHWNPEEVNTIDSEEGEPMSTYPRRRPFVAALLAAAVAGGVVGAGVYAAARGHDSTTAATVTEATAAPVARTTATTPVGVLYARNRAGVVEIDVNGTTGGGLFGGAQQTAAEGTGFVLDTKGDIATNQHVVSGGTSIRVKFADGSSYKGTVVGADASSDLAVVHVDAPASELHPLTLGDSSTVKVGDPVVAIGNPFGLAGTLTSGIVSALGREITSPNDQPIENAIQTDAAINHGNSGGPLFDLQSRVIGVTSQIQSDSNGNEGVGFAVPVNTLKLVVQQILANGKARHALLGVRVQTVSGSVAAQLHIARGVAVGTVESGSAAAHAGLKAGKGSKSLDGTTYPTGGDTITKVDSQAITSAEELRGAIDLHAPGDTVTLTVVRNGKTRTVDVTLGARTSTS
jgi:S1-C subfamily serine protease